MSTSKTEIPAASIERYERLIATVPGLECKGAASRYTSRNGHMFSFLTKEGALALRLPDDERDVFMKQHRAKPCVQHGHVMKKYVLVPAGVWKKLATLKKAFAASHAYVGSLKPKATTRKKNGAVKKTESKKAAKKKAKKAGKKQTSRKRAR